MRLPALLLLFATSLFGQDTYGPTPDTEQHWPAATESFQQKLGKATQALYLGKQVCDYVKKETMFGDLLFWTCEFKNKFVCTATIIDGQDGDYIALTAGHCIDWKFENNYYVSDTVEDSPVLRHVKIIKADNSDKYDYAIIRFSSLKDYPYIDLNKPGEDIPALGTAVLNVNFSLGIGKEYLDGKVVSEKLYGDNLKNRYLVSVGVGPGASGSAIVDSEKHCIVGLAEMIVIGTQMPTIIIPTGRNLAEFMDDDSAGLKPDPEDKSKLPKEDVPVVPKPETPSLSKQIWVVFAQLVYKILAILIALLAIAIVLRKRHSIIPVLKAVKNRISERYASSRRAKVRIYEAVPCRPEVKGAGEEAGRAGGRERKEPRKTNSAGKQRRKAVRLRTT